MSPFDDVEPSEAACAVKGAMPKTLNLKKIDWVSYAAHNNF